jgi:Myb/SANT-like DNA-binding domain
MFLVQRVISTIIDLFSLSLSLFLLVILFFILSAMGYGKSWSELDKRALIDAYTNSWRQFGRVKWGLIAKQLKLFGIDKNANSCHCKFKHIKRAYVQKIREDNFLTTDYFSEQFNRILIYQMGMGRTLIDRR